MFLYFFLGIFVNTCQPVTINETESSQNRKTFNQNMDSSNLHRNSSLSQEGARIELPVLCLTKSEHACIQIIFLTSSSHRTV